MDNAKQIKKLLIDKYGKRAVKSVKHGRGTARHWVEVTMYFSDLDWSNTAGISHRREEVEAFIERSGVHLDTYPDDMGGADNTCLLVEVRV